MNIDSLHRIGAISLLLAASISLTAQTPSPASGKKPATIHNNPGERAFKANCSRCHYAPESLSPRITGTVIRHMRVRANLSAEDERLILHYLNP
jgi:cytochrome c5